MMEWPDRRKISKEIEDLDNIVNQLDQKDICRDFPGGPVVENPPSNAGEVGWIPGQGTKIPHAMGQLSPCTTTNELTHLN